MTTARNANRSQPRMPNQLRTPDGKFISKSVKVAGVRVPNHRPGRKVAATPRLFRDVYTGMEAPANAEKLFKSSTVAPKALPKPYLPVESLKTKVEEINESIKAKAEHPMKLADSGSGGHKLSFLHSFVKYLSSYHIVSGALPSFGQWWSHNQENFNGIGNRKLLDDDISSSKNLPTIEEKFQAISEGIKTYYPKDPKTQSGVHIPVDGCLNRANLLIAELAARNITGTRIYIYREDGLNPGGKIKWGFHVAIATLDSNGIAVVADGSFGNGKLLTIPEWLKTIDKLGPGEKREEIKYEYSISEQGAPLFETGERKPLHLENIGADVKKALTEDSATKLPESPLPFDEGSLQKPCAGMVEDIQCEGVLEYTNEELPDWIEDNKGKVLTRVNEFLIPVLTREGLYSPEQRRVPFTCEDAIEKYKQEPGKASVWPQGCG